MLPTDRSRRIYSQNDVVRIVEKIGVTDMVATAAIDKLQPRFMLECGLLFLVSNYERIAISKTKIS